MKTKQFILFTFFFMVTQSWAINFTSNGINYATTGSYTVSVVQGTYIGSINIPSSVTNTGTTYSVTSIGDYAFHGCFGFTGSLNIPSSVTSIGNFAFNGSNVSGSLTIPSSVTSIGDNAFMSCNRLTGSLTIPSSVKFIGNCAFSRCSGFTGSLTIPSSITSIGDFAFENCSGLTGNLMIPTSVTLIGNSAFSKCSSLTGITIPSSVTTIGYYAFHGCKGLTGCLTIPSSVTSIGNSAFFDCSNLTGSLTIPSSVTSIGGAAFGNCTGLTSVTIPSSVTFMGRSVFYKCIGLTSIYTLAETPLRIDSTVFLDMNKDTCTLYVPQDSKNLYQAADAWKEFSNIVEFDLLAVETMKSTNGYLFYNPSDETLKLKDFRDAVDLLLYDMNGRLRLNRRLKVGENLSLQGIPKGVYVIQYLDGKSGVSQKLVKR